MKRFWTALAVALLTIFAGAGCNDYGNTFQNNTGAFISFLSPPDKPASSPQFTLTLTGAGFVAKTKVQWNGQNLVTTVPTDSSGNALGNVVTAVVPASLIATPGTASVNTINPASGTGNNGLSNNLTFIIDNPPNLVPTVTSVSPACAMVGSSLALTVTGTNFLNVPASSDPTKTQFSTLIWTLGSSQLQLTPYTATAATITATQITATIPAANINAGGNASVSVSNPPSTPIPNVPGSVGTGGGTSRPAIIVAVQSSCPTAAKAQAAFDSITAIAEETPAVSLDGRYIAYAAMQNEHSQIFLRDTCEGAPPGCQPRTTLLSVNAEGDPASTDSHAPSMSSDGRYVAFSSAASNLVENAPPGRQVYLRDTCAGAADSCKPATVLVSTDPRGALVGTESILPSVSSSGRFIAFLAITPSHAASQTSAEAKSAAGVTNSGYRQVFIRDTCLGAANCVPKTTRISLQPGDGIGTDAKPAGPAISGNAKHVAIAGANAATFFTRSVAVDDRVFLAIASGQN